MAISSGVLSSQAWPRAGRSGAGALRAQDGLIHKISPASGHYRPSEDSIARVAERLRAHGVVADGFEVVDKDDLSDPDVVRAGKGWWKYVSWPASKRGHSWGGEGADIGLDKVGNDDGLGSLAVAQQIAGGVYIPSRDVVGDRIAAGALRSFPGWFTIAVHTLMRKRVCCGRMRSL